MPAHRHFLPITLLLLAVIAVSACGTTRTAGPRTWSMTATAASGRAWTVQATDTSGRIDNAEFDPAGVTAPAEVSNPAGQANVALVSWVGGACDTQTAIAIATAGQGLSVTIRTTVAPGECDSIGVGHVLRLTSSQPLPAGSITVSSGS